MSAATQQTRNKILLTAEKLFAERGIDQTSIRLINQMAGQRNSSATQYHFGSKPGVIAALFDYRMEPINERRLQMLTELEARRQTDDLRSMVEIIVHPLAEHLNKHSEAYYYIPVVAQVIGHPGYHDIARTRRIHGTGLQRLIKMMKVMLPALPNELFMQRFGMALRQVFNELNDYQRMYLLRPRNARPEMALFISTLIDVVTAQLTAPVSQQTRRELETSRQRLA
jgi:AcrR family transcriptional regulator